MQSTMQSKLGFVNSLDTGDKRGRLTTVSISEIDGRVYTMPEILLWNEGV